ncbi:extracellular calcium-sensing receptor-like [Bombina bombina]|uniref:extracellular calcium-sensing receptor-like n=1 Tax=Bombina bombina TaxID=8345 RepID=UPI00235A58D2|nr:extracellular calcium-sensing receptor-like [Bombina bombina]
MKTHHKINSIEMCFNPLPEKCVRNFKKGTRRVLGFNFESFQQLQALIFAVEEINNNSNILPNITLGFQIYDSCGVLQQDLKGTLQVLTGWNWAIPNYRCLHDVPLTAIIGHSISTHSILLAHILGLYRYPQISHFSTSPLLSDRRQFPSFFRTVPSDSFQTIGLAKLVIHFGWTWLGLLAIDNDYGQQGIQLVKQEIIKAGACVAFTENILISQPNRNAPYIVKIMKESNVKAIVIFSSAVDLIPIFDEMLVQNVTGKTLIASEAWSTSDLFLERKYSSLLSGTVGLALYSGIITGFEEFLGRIHPSMSHGGNWMRGLWEKIFRCKFSDQQNITDSLNDQIKQCTGIENLENIQKIYDILSLRVSYYVYTAVHVVGKAMDSLQKCIKENTMGKCPDVLNFKPWQLLHYVKNVKVLLTSGKEISFDENGDPPAMYDIVNWQLSSSGIMKHAKVGSYDTAALPGQHFIINTSALWWATEDQKVPLSICSPNCPPGFRKVVLRGELVCCFRCVPCPQGEISNHTDALGCIKCPADKWPNLQKSECLPKTIEYLSFDDPLGATLASTSIISSLVPVIILRLFIQYKTSPIVKANNYYLSCLLLVSISLCFLCTLSFIGYPQKQNCLLRQIGFGMVFALCISCILAKTIMVVLAFMASKPASNLRKCASPFVSYMVIFICSLLQFIICVSWVFFSPSFPELKIESFSRLIIIQCNEGSPEAFWSMLGYLGVLATGSFIVAFFARKLPDSFNEAKCITFSMFAFLCVWMSFIAAYLSSSGKNTVVMEVFAILFSSWALLICMFAPKCFVILLRPNMNTRGHLMRKIRTVTVNTKIIYI